MTPLRASLLALATAGTLVAAPAFAATADDTFTVSITVENDCTIDMDDMDFGTQNDMDPAHTATAGGDVECTGSSAWTVAFSAGGSGDVTAREMDLAGEKIAYNLYRDTAHSEILGDGTGGTFLVAGSADDDFTIYGRTEPNQNAKSNGTYSDTIIATVSF